MSVTVMRMEDALKLDDPDEVQHTLPINKNFFEHFGTAGCELGCESKRSFEANLQLKKGAIPIRTRNDAKAVRRSLKKEHRLQQPWFTSSELARSKHNGCGSCMVLEQILTAVFPECANDTSDLYSYSVTPMWELKCRKTQIPGSGSGPVSHSESIVQLFQPQSVTAHFEEMPTSSLLLGRTRSIARLKRWVGTCLNTHTRCATSSIPWTDGMRPARLIKIQSFGDRVEPDICLIETMPGQVYKYVCLSHRWDDGVKFNKTTLQNLAERKSSINLASLPGNFRDAVVIAHELGIQHLWIDSICIVQEGDDGRDLGREIAKMGFIYQNAQFVVAAVSSPDSVTGCFMNDHWPDMCLRIEDSSGQAHIIGARVLDGRGQVRNITDLNELYPLLTRAWVFQERLLSTRLLQCSYGEFSYACLESWKCECRSTLAPHPSTRVLRNATFLGDRHIILRGPNGLQSQGAQSNWKRSVLYYWRTLTQQYMELGITISADILPAIGGCAQVLAHHLQLKYVAGLWSGPLSTGPTRENLATDAWKETLVMDLLWHVRFQTSVQGQTYAKKRPRDSTAPSWSWASIAMGRTIAHIGWDDRNSDWVSTQPLLGGALREAHYEPEVEENPFGRLKTAYLRLNATLYPWHIRFFCYVAKRESPYESRNRPDIYARRVDHSMRCTTNIAELDINGALVELQLDANTAKEDLPFVQFTGCVNTGKSTCALSEIYLLHALHKGKPSRSFDVFLVLQKIEPTLGKPNCYQRIGLWKLIDKNSSARTWEHIARGRIQPRVEELWLF